MTVKDVLTMLYGLNVDEVHFSVELVLVDTCQGDVSDVYHHDAYGWSTFKVDSFSVELGNDYMDPVLTIDMDVTDYRRRLDIV